MQVSEWTVEALDSIGQPCNFRCDVPERTISVTALTSEEDEHAQRGWLDPLRYPGKVDALASWTASAPRGSRSLTVAASGFQGNRIPSHSDFQIHSNENQRIELIGSKPEGPILDAMCFLFLEERGRR
jgi:hypothetical protein